MTMNELELAKTFREQVGLEQERAEAVAIAIFDAIRSNVATKADIELVRADIRLLEQRFDSRLRTTAHRLMWAGVFGLVSSIGMIITALHYWPPR